MTQKMMRDPVDHWVDLDQRPIRRPLLMEMMAAYDEALAAPTDPPHRRAAWTGVGTGYAIAFGFITRNALDRARRVPRAITIHPDEFRPSAFSDEDTAWASGILYGYYMGTSEGLDVATCEQCGQRLVHDLDEIRSCHHGYFCDSWDDHIADWHRGGGFGPDICTYVDGLGDAA